MSRFEQALERLHIEGEVTLADGWTNPEGARAALAAEGSPGSLVLELSPLADEGAAGEFGPLPRSPVFARVGSEPGALELAGTGSEPTKKRATRIAVVTEVRNWGAGGSPFTKTAAEIRVVLDGPSEGSAETGSTKSASRSEELSFGGVVADDQGAALDALAPLASALAARLGIPLEGVDEPRDVVTGGVRSKLRPADAARFSLGFEGEHLVLRDHESRGPREGAARSKLIALLCFIPSVGSLATFAWELRSYLADPNAGVGLVLGPLALGLVLGIAAYAFFEIARFAEKYTASSEPLAWFSDDRVVVAPWVSRQGAIDTRPGGRFGTAIRTSEITGTTVRERDGVHAVVLEGAHGPFDVLLSDDAHTAAHFGSLVERAVKSVASPEKKRTALLRAQERRGKRVSPAEA